MPLKDKTTAEKIRHLTRTPAKQIYSELRREIQQSLGEIPTEVRKRHLVLQLLKQRLDNFAPPDKIIELWYKLRDHDFPELYQILSSYDLIYQKELRSAMDKATYQRD